MWNRAYINIKGQPGAGKTALIETVLRSLRGETMLCVHSVRDDDLQRPVESAPKKDPHLTRYLSAGASSVAMYRFPQRKKDFIDAFFESRAMLDFSDAILIEGDSPLDFLHLSVFVARPFPAGETLLRAGVLDARAQRKRELERREILAEHPELLLQLLPQSFVSSIKPFVDKQPDILRSVGESLKREVKELRAIPIPKSTRRWMLAESHRGIEAAGLVVVNIHDESERGRAEALVGEVARLRSDKEVFDDVLGWGHHRLPVTAVAANLGDPKDAGLKKAIARVKRAVAKAKEG